MGLLNRDLILRNLTHDAPWCGSHGADGAYLGMGLIYYGIVYMKQAKVAVCLGSGGGFVPRMMRQAQRDLGIADRSKTILVDANRPEAGWGAPTWLEPNSFFRQNYGDIELIITSTREAANKYFTEQAITIDYLHIDADHSFEACLEDFRIYRRFLRKDSFVTLHDTNFNGAGVKHVVEYLRTRSDCEVIDVQNVGCGTALVQVVGPTTEEMAPLPKPYGALDGPVVLTRKANLPVLAPPEIGWKYLESEAFSSRSILAAYFVKDCPSVIEIGGGNTPIDLFLTGRHESVIVVDPFIRESRNNTMNGQTCSVWHVRARFQDVCWHVERSGNYGLVMLGLELQGLTDADYRILYHLVDQAWVTVIEFPTSWVPSREQFDRIRSNTRTGEVFGCKLDLQGNDVGCCENSWPPRFDREVHVLKPKREES